MSRVYRRRKSATSLLPPRLAAGEVDDAPVGEVNLLGVEVLAGVVPPGHFEPWTDQLAAGVGLVHWENSSRPSTVAGEHCHHRVCESPWRQQRGHYQGFAALFKRRCGRRSEVVARRSWRGFGLRPSSARQVRENLGVRAVVEGVLAGPLPPPEGGELGRRHAPAGTRRQPIPVGVSCANDPTAHLEGYARVGSRMSGSLRFLVYARGLDRHAPLRELEMPADTMLTRFDELNTWQQATSVPRTCRC